MTPISRRRALLLALTAPLFSAQPGCDPNPAGPTFPAVPPEKDEDDAGSEPGAPGATKGRKKKKQPHAGMIADPAA